MDPGAGAVQRGQRIVDRYVIEEEIGRGGMATVYRARDTKHETLVALKLLRPDLAAFVGPTRFDREIRITAQLQHPNIVAIFDSGEHEKVPFYVMPFIQGESLAARLKREGVLGVAEAVRITCDVAKALAFAHGLGIIHRDVKPANILLHGDQVLLADFGVARAVSLSGTDSITDSGIALGTAHYMSPEQAAGTAVDHRADIYSLACVLYELLAGTPPFTGPAQMVIARHSLELAPQLHTFRRDVPEGVEQAVLKGMAKVAGDRFASAKEFSVAVQAGLREGTSHAVHTRRRTVRATVGVIGVIAAIVFFALRGPSAPLDRTRVMVFPLVVPVGFTGPQSAGEDAATIIGSALDGTDPLRWLDGWSQLTPEQRDQMRNVPLRDLTRVAAERRCGWAVTGRLVMRGDSVSVALELHDVGANTLADEKSATGTVSESWRAALVAIGELLPTLIPEGARRLADEFENRPPAAIASFLLGEAAFRRVKPDDAFAHYEHAVDAGSTFALAALRGAQAASWRHRASDASAMLDRVAGLPLPARYAAFVTGFRHYLTGAADSAAAAFNRAIALDPEMVEAWTQLGEVYTHLLPLEGNTDFLAAVALTEARRLDPGGRGPLFHLIEQGLSGPQPTAAKALVDAFLAGQPDSTLAAQVRVMQQCAVQGADAVEWERELGAEPLGFLLAAMQLAGGAARLDCAERAFNTILAVDTAATPAADNRRFYSMLSLETILSLSGRSDEAVATLERFITRWGAGTSLFYYASPFDTAFRARALEVARADAVRSAPQYRGMASTNRLWQVGVVEATFGDTAAARTIARELARRTALDSSTAPTRLTRSIDARLALRAADTLRAFTLLETLVPSVASGVTLNWDVAAPMAGERLLYAQLLAARGEGEKAIAVASVLDSPRPAVHLVALRESLRFRAATAEALGLTRSAAQYRARLGALAATRVAAGP